MPREAIKDACHGPPYAAHLYHNHPFVFQQKTRLKLVFSNVRGCEQGIVNEIVSAGARPFVKAQ